VKITEALQEHKTIGRRILKKQEYILEYLWRRENEIDPLAKEGGSAEVVKRERQAIRDLQERQVELRREIARANASNSVTVNGVTKTIADWIVWKREIAPLTAGQLDQLRQKIREARAQRQETRLIGQGRLNQLIRSEEEAEKRPIINIDEAALAKEIEAFEEIKGQLDGLLSLSNATIDI